MAKQALATQNSDYNLEDVLEAKRRDGSLIREKARVLTEDWLDKVYPRMCDPDISTTALMDIGKTLMELGDLKPKKDITPAQTGPGFSITINIPTSQPNGHDPIVIEGVALPVEPDYAAPYSSEPDDTEDLLPALDGAGPVNFNTLDFQFNHDLSSGVTDYEGDEM